LPWAPPLLSASIAALVISGSDGSWAWTAVGFWALNRSTVRLPLLKSPKIFSPEADSRSERVATVWDAGEPSTV